MQKSGGIRAGFQGLEGGVVPVKIKALASLRSSDYRWIAGIAEAFELLTSLPDDFMQEGRNDVLPQKRNGKQKSNLKLED